MADRAVPDHRSVGARAGAAVLLLLLMLAACSDGQDVPSEPSEDADEQQVESEPERGAHLLTGVPTEEVPDRPALLVKVSNSPEARPHTGIEAADVVFEELTEGGVTRFLAVFHSELPEVVGPVRSTRPVDLQLMAGFGLPGFAHSGAREEVRDMLADAPAVAITEGAAGFFRDDGTYASNPVAPHNLFIEVEPALDAVVEAGALPLEPLGWVFTEDPPAGADAVDGEELEVEMSTAFRTDWTYDADDGVYRRAQNGIASEVTGPGRIGAANVVVLAVRHYTGASGYPETDVLGEGEALVLRDGRRYAARWSKPAETDPLLVLRADGAEPFPFAPGPTWILLPDSLPTTQESSQ